MSEQGAKPSNVVVDSQLSFEESLSQVERVVRELENGQLPLGDSIGAYEQAVAHLKHCYGLLSAAERRVQLLTAVDENGQATTVAFDDEATASGSQAAPARRKRAVKKSSTDSDTDGASDLLSGLE